MYYPKNKIKTNLYTNGNELVYRNSLVSYSGFYYKTYDGKYFSGKSNDDITSEELISIISTNNADKEYQIAIESQTNPDVSSINTTLINLGYTELGLPQFSQLPKFTYSQPTQEDYKKGRFERYFVKKSNEPTFIEIDKLQFERFLSKDTQYAWQFYIPFNMTWLIAGDKVKETNFRIASQIQSNNKVYGFVKYLELTGGFDKFYPKVGHMNSGSYIDRVNQGYVLDNRDRRGNRVFDSQNDSGSIRRDNSTPR
jgi:hypothetical protein